MSNKPELDPSTPSANYVAMTPTWNKIDVLLGGTERMRAAGESMMPRHENETAGAYHERLSRATLLNLSKLTLDQWTGKPFSEPVNVGDDVPSQIAEWLEDVDLQGNDVSVVSRDWFRKGLAKAFCHMLVDAPEDDGVPRTAADDTREGVRPYWNLVNPENLFAAEARMIDGKEVLTHVRIFERETVRDGFAEATIDRIREFNRILPGESALQLVGMDREREIVSEGALPDEDMGALLAEFERPGVWVTVWRKVEKKEKDDKEWVIDEAPRRLDDRMDEIPLVTFYSDREDLLRGKPHVEDIVDLNINWWQSNSDQNIVLTVARFPLLALSGGDEDEVVVEVGPKRMLFTPDPKGKFYYVEHAGAAIEAGRNHLQDLENQMAHYGAEFLRRKPGGETATARALDSAEATSPLEDAAMRFNESLNKALKLTGKWVGVEDVGRVSVTTEFDPVEVDGGGDLDALDKARKRKDLSRHNFFEELRRRGTVREEFDHEENDKELEEERTDEGFGGAPTDGLPIDPLAEDDPEDDDPPSPQRDDEEG